MRVVSLPIGGPYLPNCKKKAVLLCLSDEFANKLPKTPVAQFSNESTTSSDPSAANDIIDAAKWQIHIRPSFITGNRQRDECVKQMLL